MNLFKEKLLAEKDQEKRRDKEEEDQEDIRGPFLKDDVNVHQTIFQDRIGDETDHDDG